MLLAETESGLPFTITQAGVAVVIAWLVIERLFKLVSKLIENRRETDDKKIDPAQAELIATLRALQTEIRHLTETLGDVKEDVSKIWEVHNTVSSTLAATVSRVEALERSKR